MIELFTQPGTWVALVTLTALELVLGIDNIIFISILADKLPPEQRQKVREEAAKAGKTKDGRPVAIDVGKVLGDLPQGNADTGGASEATNPTGTGGTPE